MKRILITLAISLTVLFPSSAQEGLRFLGVPVSGTVRNCGQALGKQGFRKDRTEARILRGKYRGIPAELLLSGTDGDSGEVSVFVLTFPVRSDWRSTVSLYETVRMMLTSDYGTPSLSVEEYDFPYGEADGFRALESGKCRFVTSYSIYPGGTTDDGLTAMERKRTSVSALGEVTLTISDDKKVRVFLRTLR